MMTSLELKKKLTNIRFATLSYGLRKEGKVVCKSSTSAKEFAINFLVSLAVAGVDFSDAELIAIYEEIHKLVIEKDKISTSEIPYAQNKNRPSTSHMLTINEYTIFYE